METSIKKVQKITSKGQITLPISWRRKFKTNYILIKSNGDLLRITPFYIDSKKTCK